MAEKKELKAVQQGLASLLGRGKKPNVFYKGMNTDTDEFALGNDQYRDAINVRLINSDSDIATLQNIRSDVGIGNLSLSVFKFEPDPDHHNNYPYQSITHDSFFDNATENQGSIRTWIKLVLTRQDGSTITAGIKLNSSSSPYYDKIYPHDSQGTSSGRIDALGKDMLGHILYEISEGLQYSTPNFSDGVTVSIKPGIFPNDTGYLNFQSKTSSPVTGIAVSYSITDTDTYSSAVFTTVSASGYSAVAVNHQLRPLAQKSFGDFVAILATSSTGNEVIVKAYLDRQKESLEKLSSLQLVVEASFQYSGSDGGGYQAVKMIKVDENEKYRRLYFTDGIQPVKTVNLEATASFYSNFNNPDDFNIFSKSPLKPIEILNIGSSGNVKSGSWSYCYKLITGAGSGSVVSPISNPLSLFAGAFSSTYSSTIGAEVGDNSNKSVSLKISGIDTAFDKIQLIGIHYLDDLGSAAFYQLKEEKISGSQTEIFLTHNGTESTTPITAFETLVDANTWDVAKDIEVKDNRLFASNLTNSSFDIQGGESIFRVRQYKHTGADSRVNNLSGSGSAANNFDGVPDSGAFVAHPGLNNPDVNDPLLYLYTYDDKTKYRYAEGPDATSRCYYGASTPGFNNTGDVTGVKVTFKLKPFRLDNRVGARDAQSPDGNMTGRVNWWSGPHEVLTFGNDGNDYFVTTPFYGPSTRSGEDGYWDNYQSPIFCHKYTGYMRGEVYRFAIQFYDKQGNDTFSYPIGDLRFPEIMSDYMYNTMPENTEAGTHVAGGFTADDGVVPPYQHSLCSDEGIGQILYPHFVVKLSEDIRDKISGFSIVRAERNEEDESVRMTGILNHLIRHKDEEDQKECRNRYALDTNQLFDPNLTSRTHEWGDATEGHGVKHEMYTIDSPDVLLGKKNFNCAGNKIMVVGQLKPYSFHQSDHPDSTSSSDDWEFAGNVPNDYGEDQSTNRYYVASTLPDYTVEPNLGYMRRQSNFAKYYSDESNIILNNAAYAEATGTSSAYRYLNDLHFGQVVAPREVISPSLLADVHGDYDGFVNSGIQFYDNNTTNQFYTTGSAADDYVDVGGATKSNLFWGNTTYFINLVSGRAIVASMISKETGLGNNWVGLGDDGLSSNPGIVHISSKLYVKIIRESHSGRYGGNSRSNFETTRWISTGYSRHGREVQAVNSFGVFGGDTFVNYYSLNKKFDGGSAGAYTTSAVKGVQGIIFPVESRVNIDMRRGRYFGKDRAHLNLEDEYLYSKSYSATNNIKSFPAKDASLPDVDKFPQTIAVSNVKIAGQTSDSFSRFDVNETFDVDANYGPINNLIKFRDTLYAIQSNGVTKLDVNAKALIKDELGQQVTIASGTGTVISDSKYISTLYGSQNRMNCIVTEKSFYFVDHNNRTICRLSASRAGEVVEDLLLAKFCKNLLADTGKYYLKDYPLASPGTNIANRLVSANVSLKAGGIHCYHDPEFQEVGFSMSYHKVIDASQDSGEMVSKHITFNEHLDCFVTERSTYVLTSFLHNGALYNLSRNSGLSFDYTSRVFATIALPGEAVGANSNNYGSYGGVITSPFQFAFVNNEDIGHTKIYDKIVSDRSQSTNPNFCVKFTWKTNFQTSTLNGSVDYKRTTINRDIYPIVENSTPGSETRVQGNYIYCKVESGSVDGTYVAGNEINLWSYTIHYRKTII